jgi:hypothetical protein
MKGKTGRLPGHTPEPELAKRNGVKLETQQKKRRRGETHAYVYYCRQYHYVDEDEPRWLKSLRVTPPRSGQVKNQRHSKTEEATA